MASQNTTGKNDTNNGNNDSKYMFASQSHVRNACDACHKRKIRCMVSRNGGPCQNCKSRGLSCYFLPRYRSGRPRIREQSSPETVEIQTITPPNSSIWPADKPVTSPMSRKSPKVAHQNSNDDLFDWVSQDDFAMQTEQHGYGLQDPNHQLAFSSVIDTALMDIQPPTFTSFAEPTHSAFPGLQSDDFPSTTPSPPDIRRSTWSTASRQQSNNSGSRGEAAKECGFASLLEQCAKLQRHLLATEEDTSLGSEDDGFPVPKKIELSSGQLQVMLEDIDASCKLMLEMCDEEHSTKSALAETNQALDSASASLIIAVVFKVFQICEVLFNGQVLRVHSMKDLLLQKRLDFNITQARVVMARIEQLTQNRQLMSQELSRKALRIEERFTNQCGRSSTDLVIEPKNVESPVV